MAAHANSRVAEAEQEYHAAVNWAAPRVFALPELCALIAEHGGVVVAWRLMRVCKAMRQGATEFLITLPGLVVCGGVGSGFRGLHDVWRLDLATMRGSPCLLS